MSSTITMIYQIWNDTTGERIEVGEDTDGLDLMEIRFYSQNDVRLSDVRFDVKDTDKVVEALNAVSQFLLRRGSEKDDKEG